MIWSAAKLLPGFSGELKAGVAQRSWHGTCALLWDHLLWDALQDRVSLEKGLACDFNTHGSGFIRSG